MYHELAPTLGADYAATPSSTLAAHALDQRPSIGAHASAYVVEPEHSCHCDQARWHSSPWHFVVHSAARYYRRGHVLQRGEEVTNSDLQKVRDALVAADRALLSVRELNEALAILDAALEETSQQEFIDNLTALVQEQRKEIDRLHAALAAEPQPVAWTSVKDAMPKSGVKVLACYKNSHGNLRRIRAKWTAAKTVEANAEYDWGEHDEETDTYWTPEGWYECIDNWDEYSSVMVSEGEVTHWMPLPLAPDDPLYTAPVAAPQDATDWEGIAADQAMTIAMLKVDYQQLQDLVTSQGIALMEQEEWQKDAAKYRWLLRLFVYLGDSPAETLDAAIVKTMAKMPLEDV